MKLTDSERKKLWAKSGNRCAYDYQGECCNAELVDTLNGNPVLLGDECHIIGDKPTSARYKEECPERETYENAILLCKKHHSIIDDSETAYPVEMLYEMKSRHEKRVQQLLERGTIQPIIIQDSVFSTYAENVKKAVGMEVNHPAQLSNVKSELHVKNVENATGFSTNQGMTAALMYCPHCGRGFSKVFIGPPPDIVECPFCRCSINHKV